MKSSLLFRRVFSLLGVALALWIVLTVILYTYIASPIFTRMKAREVEPLARFLASRTRFDGNDLDPLVLDTIKLSYEMFGCYLFLVHERGHVILHTPLPEALKALDRPIIKTVVQASESLSSQDEPVVLTKRMTGAPTAYMFVIVPVKATTPGDAGTLAAVQPMAEINAGILSINLALFGSSLTVLFVMIIPIWLATKRLLRPLQSVRSVALAMTRGDFSQRADESVGGEFHDLAVAVNHLASELSTHLNSLIVERNRLGQIVNGIAEGIVAVDAKGLVTVCNDKVWDVFAVKTTLSHAYTPQHFLRLTKLDAFFFDAMASNHVISHVVEKDHRKIHCLIAPLTRANGQTDGAVGLFRDITESERLEQTRRDYVANISHELRTPLTSMRALLEPLADGMVTREADKARYYGILLRETLRLSTLINNLLELSRLQASDDVARLTVVPMASVLEPLVARYTPLMRDKEIAFTLEGMKAAPSVWSNADWLSQIVAIFIDNALKFTPQGGHITVRVTTDDTHVDIGVRDDGEGIKPEDIGHVFDRFFKADRAHNEPGTGLGLSIASEMAKKIGAHLSVKSDVGRGSVFSVRVQRADKAIAALPLTEDVDDPKGGHHDAS